MLQFGCLVVQSEGFVVVVVDLAFVVSQEAEKVERTEGFMVLGLDVGQMVEDAVGRILHAYHVVEERHVDIGLERDVVQTITFSNFFCFCEPDDGSGDAVVVEGILALSQKLTGLVDLFLFAVTGGA